MKQHTDQRYEAELAAIRDLLATMGGTVEAMIGQGVDALIRQDATAAQAVIDRDQAVDLLEQEVDDRCIQVLARRQPTASDLRFLAAGLKIVVDLERVGDVAVNIAERALELAPHPPLKPYVDLPRMAGLARAMLSDALDAFARGDAELARGVFLRDNAVDALYAQTLRELITYMLESPANIYRATKLLSVAKYLERIGDHATNLAEQAIFLVEGRDVRHSGLGRPDPGDERFVRPERGVLFVCTANAARSPMAEGWARKLAPAGIVAASAGLRPAGIHPLAIRVMDEVGIDLSGARSRGVDQVDPAAFDVVVFMDEGIDLPDLAPGARRVRWALPDPLRSPEPDALDAFRRVRDELAARVARLLRDPRRP
jgi:phosphate transport system protein